MNAGRLQQVGTPREIYEQPATLFIAGFIGLSDFFQGQVMVVEGDRAQVVVGGLALSVPARAGMVSGQPVTLFIRPNDVVLVDESAGAAENTFPGRVDKVTYLGDLVDYRVILANGLELRVQTDGRTLYPAGSPVQVRLPAERCHVLAQ